MSVQSIRKVVLIGAGNLATQLGLAMKRNAIEVIQVCDRTPANGLRLAKKLGAEYVQDPGQLLYHADLYILSISDKAIAQVAERINLPDRLVIHTSGSVGMDVLKKVSPRIGVWYPLQTFSKHRRISFRGIPVCVEAGNINDQKSLVELGTLLSGNVHLIDSNQRRVVHMTAVFANNFTNFMFAIAEDLLHTYQIPFDLLKPLIQQTAENVRHEELFRHQTGPAIREDLAVMEEHLGILEQHPAYRDIYELISRSIIQYKKAHGQLQGTA